MEQRSIQRYSKCIAPMACMKTLSCYKLSGTFNLFGKEVNMVLIVRQLMLAHLFSTFARACLSSIALR